MGVGIWGLFSLSKRATLLIEGVGCLHLAIESLARQQIRVLERLEHTADQIRLTALDHASTAAETLALMHQIEQTKIERIGALLETRGVGRQMLRERMMERMKQGRG